MQTSAPTRRTIGLTLAMLPFLDAAARAQMPAGKRAIITDFGAVADSAGVCTKAIQAAIDHLSGNGGGTVVVPPGVFVCGALHFKPKVNLHLEKGAVLRCSTEMSNFPPERTRIEGHFEARFTPALINVSGCDGFRLTGAGTLDGAGRPIWDEFWKRRNAAKDPHNFPNLGLARARLALIETSRNVVVDGVTFKDSQFWNLHLYKCRDVVVRNARFEVPDDYHQAPSTDGIDLDSCQNVTVDGCYFSVTDDCIAAKGSKGPHALEDKSSPPVEHIRIRNCTFRRGNGILTLGSEATIVRDAVVENCRVIGRVKVAVLKLRSDTPQQYEDIHFRNLTLDCTKGALIMIQPWSQYTDLKGASPPKSIVRDISLTNIKGRTESFGNIQPNPGQTEIRDIFLKNIAVDLQHPKLTVADGIKVRYQNVVINGQIVTE